MDNGLIFPYPCQIAPDESVVLTVLKHLDHLRVTVVWMHGTSAGSSQAMG